MFEMEGGMDGGKETEITRERSMRARVHAYVHVGVCGMGWKVGHGVVCVKHQEHHIDP